MNHEKTKFKKHEIFRIIFRDFVMKKEASNLERFAESNLKPATRNMQQFIMAVLNNEMMNNAAKEG